MLVKKQGKIIAKLVSRKRQDDDLNELLSGVDAKQLRKALRALQQGELGLADTLPARDFLNVLKKYRKGDLSVRLPETQTGIAGDIARTFNACVAMQQEMTEQLASVAHEVGTRGNFAVVAQVSGASGEWAQQLMRVNQLTEQLTAPISATSTVLAALAKGDFTTDIVSVAAPKGELKALHDNTHKLTTRLSHFAQQLQGAMRGEAVPATATKVALPGTWRELLSLVHKREQRAHAQLQILNETLNDLAVGNFPAQLAVGQEDEFVEFKQTVNSLNAQFTAWYEYIAWFIQCGLEGDLTAVSTTPPPAGSGYWGKLNNNVQQVAVKWHAQFNAIQASLDAMVRGELAVSPTTNAKGFFLKIKKQINQLNTGLSQFCQEITATQHALMTESKVRQLKNPEKYLGIWQSTLGTIYATHAQIDLQLSHVQQDIVALSAGKSEPTPAPEAKGRFLALQSALHGLLDKIQLYHNALDHTQRLVVDQGKLTTSTKSPGISGFWQASWQNQQHMLTALQQQWQQAEAKVNELRQGLFTSSSALPVHGDFAKLHDNLLQLGEELQEKTQHIITWSQLLGREGQLQQGLTFNKAPGQWHVLQDGLADMQQHLWQQVQYLFEISNALIAGELTQLPPGHAVCAGDFAVLQRQLHVFARHAAQLGAGIVQALQQATQQGLANNNLGTITLGGAWDELRVAVNTLLLEFHQQIGRLNTLSQQLAQGDFTATEGGITQPDLGAVQQALAIVATQATTFFPVLQQLFITSATVPTATVANDSQPLVGSWRTAAQECTMLAATLTDLHKKQQGFIVNLATLSETERQLQQRYALLEHEKAQADANLDALKSESTQLRTEVHSLQQAQQQWEYQRHNIGSSQQELLHKIELLQQEKSQVLLQLEQATQQIAQLQQLHVTAQDEKREALQQMALLQQQTQHLTQSTQHLEHVYQQLGKDKEELKAKVQAVEQEKKSLLSELTTLHETLSDSQQAYAVLHEQQQQAQQNKLLLEQQIAHVTQAKQHTEQSYTTLTRNNTLLQEQFTQTDQARQAAQAQAETLQDQLQELQQAHHAIVAAQASAVQQLESCRQDIEQLTRAKQEAQQAYELLCLDKQQVDEQLAVIQQQHAQLSASATLAECTVQRLQQLSDSMQLENQQLHGQLVLHTEQITLLQADIARHADTLQQAQQQEKATQQQKQRLTDKLQTLALEKQEFDKTVAQLQQFNRTLGNKTKELQQVIQKNQTLLTEVMDAIKKPLSSSQIIVKALSRTVHNRLAKRDHKFMDKLAENTAGLLTLVNEVPLLSALNISSNQLHIMPLKLHTLLNAWQVKSKQLTQDKGVQWAYQLADTLPPFIYTDKQRLQQLLTDLLHLALQQTEGGVIRFSAKAIGTAGYTLPGHTVPAERIVLVFADTGHGMTSLQQQQALDPFAYGITTECGLAWLAASRLAQLLGGELQLASSVGRGTVITLYLPLQHNNVEIPTTTTEQQVELT